MFVKGRLFLIDRLVIFLKFFLDIKITSFNFDQPFNQKYVLMPRSPEQYYDIRKQKKELIMGVALELFAEKGFHTTSMSQIAKKAGISKGLTYNYFESKAEILNELMDHGFNEIYENLDIGEHRVLTKDEFIHFIKQNFRLIRENMQHWKLFFSLLLQPQVSASFSEKYAEKAEPLFHMFFEFIKASGSKDPESDLMAIASMLEGSFLYCVAAPDVFPMDKLEEAVLNSCFKIING